jgi:hypothetical protein
MKKNLSTVKFESDLDAIVNATSPEWKLPRVITKEDTVSDLEAYFADSVTPSTIPTTDTRLWMDDCLLTEDELNLLDEAGAVPVTSIINHDAWALGMVVFATLAGIVACWNMFS